MPRHQNHDKILDMIMKGEPFKQIAYQCGAPLRTVQDIANNFTEVIRVRKFDPGEGQRSFWGYFRTGPRKP